MLVDQWHIHRLGPEVAPHHLPWLAALQFGLHHVGSLEPAAQVGLHPVGSPEQVAWERPGGERSSS